MDERYDMPDVMPSPGGPTDMLNAEYMQRTKVENIISQLNPETLLVDIEHRLRKMRKDNFTQEWKPINPNQKEVNRELVTNMISYLSPFLTNNVTFSNYTEVEINRIMRLIIRDVIEDLITNAEEYGIDGDYPEMNRITEVVCTCIYSALKRALKGSEASKLWKSLNISGDIDSGMNDQKKGIKDYFKLW